MIMDVKQTHCGQYKRYGDFFREWDVKTDDSKERFLDWFFENLYPCEEHLPESSEFRKRTVYGGDKFGDMDYYFSGYYQIREIQGGFHIAVCEPYAD